MSRRALVVYNPAARKAPHLERLRAAAEAVAGWEVTIEVTAAAGHATELAREAAAHGLDAVVACGGDGTVNEVVNGLAGSETALLAVRGGTANVWAKEARLPKKPERALRVLEDGEVRTIDLGRAGERYFLLLASAGFDAAVVASVSSSMKRRFGAAAFVLRGLRLAMSYQGAEAELRADGEALSGPLYWFVLGNTRSYGGVLQLTHLALADDGALDLLLLRKGGLPRLLWLALCALVRRHHRRAHVVSRRLESLDVVTPGLPVQVDGEYLGETPLTFSVAPRALRVLVPRGLRSGLFGQTTKDSLGS